MNHFLLSLLLLTAQPIFCGGIISYFSQTQNEQEVSTDDEQDDAPDNVQRVPNFESSSDVSFECDPKAKNPFKISYKESLNGITFDSVFYWSDSGAKNNLDAIERRLACETNPATQKALSVALKFQRVLRALQ